MGKGWTLHLDRAKLRATALQVIGLLGVLLLLALLVPSLRATPEEFLWVAGGLLAVFAVQAFTHLLVAAAQVARRSGAASAGAAASPSAPVPRPQVQSSAAQDCARPGSQYGAAARSPVPRR